MKKIAYVGVDYHIKTVTIAVMIEGEKDVKDTVHLKNEDKVIRKYLKKLAMKFVIRVCYEASAAGYVFQRKVWKWGYHCDVIAPSLPRQPRPWQLARYRSARARRCSASGLVAARSGCARN